MDELNNAIDELKHAICCGGPNELRNAASAVWEAYDNYLNNIYDAANIDRASAEAAIKEQEDGY